MIEHNKRKCKKCLQEKDRVAAGKFPNGRDKKWAELNGKLWNGNICGDCNVSRANETMKKLRNREDSNL